MENNKRNAMEKAKQKSLWLYGGGDGRFKVSAMYWRISMEDGEERIQNADQVTPKGYFY